MSFGSLYIGVSGMTAAQRAMEVVANNVANVNTDGYSRQRVDLVNSRPVPGTYGNRGDGMRGTGVTIADVVRARSDLVDTALRSESQIQASWSAKADIMGRAEQVLGPMGGGTPKALADFFASWEELSLQPDSPAARQAVIQAGATLAGSFRSAASDLDALSTGTADLVRDDVAEVNRLAAQVAHLNAGIADATNGQQSPNDLLDQRDRLLDRLSSLAGTTVRASDMGRVDVYIGGRALVRGETVEKLTASGTTPAAVTWEFGGAAAPGGHLGGLTDSGATLVSLRSELDAVANDLRTLVNTAHGAGFTLDGSAGPAFFKGTLGAGDLDMNITDVADVAAAATAAGAPADGNHALAMAALRLGVLAGGLTGSTAEDGLHGFAARLGGLASESADSALASNEVLNGLKQDRAQISSVSTDEEMADMVRFQRAYEASARLLTTLDQMLDRLINSTGLVGR
jgi:flagellar hook-associated protein 1 FlgK